MPSVCIFLCLSQKCQVTVVSVLIDCSIFRGDDGNYTWERASL